MYFPSIDLPQVYINLDFLPWALADIMFYLSLLEHKFGLPPEYLPTKLQDEEHQHPLENGIRKQLENFFLDKVIPNLGLCISIYDIRNISGGDIAPAAGYPNYKVKFRVIVFRPHKGEVISATLCDSNDNGLRLSLGFFDDIYIPSHLFLDNSSKETDRWDFEDDEQSDSNRYYIFGDCEIKFRVESVSFPPVPTESNGQPFAPMLVYGSIEDLGLGPVSWWK